MRRRSLLLFVFVTCIAPAWALDAVLTDGWFTKWGEHGAGLFQQIEIDGHFAYCLPYPDGLHVFDISDPSKPRLVGHARDFDDSYAFVLRDGYAYCTNYYGLQVFDVSDPSTPRLVGRHSEHGGSRIALWGNYAFLGETYQPTIWIYDVSEPSHPFPIGSYRLQEASYGFGVMRAADARLYVTTGEQGLFVLDISDVTEIRLIGRWEKRNIRDIDLSGSHAIALLSNDWFALDISTPANIQSLASAHLGATLNRVDLCGSRAWISHSTGIFLMDVSDWQLPAEIWHCDIPGGPVAGSGDVVVFMGNDNLCLARYDPDGFSEDLTGRYLAPGPSSPSMCADGDLVFLASPYSQVFLYDCTLPSEPQWISTVQMSFGNDIGRMDTAQGYLFIANAQAGLHILDVTNPVLPAEVGSCQLPEPIAGVRCQWPFAYTWNYDGLYVVDVSNPAFPAYIGFCDLFDEDVMDVYVDGIYAYVTTKEGLSILNVADPYMPARIGEVYLSGDSGKVAVRQGQLACVSMGDSGLQICDVRNKRAPRPLRRLDLGDFVADVVINGEVAYASVGKEGVFAISIQDFKNPAILGSVETPNWANDLDIRQNTVYLDLYLLSYAHFQILHHVIIGDLDGDGCRRLSDLVLLHGYLAGRAQPEEAPFVEPIRAGDADRNEIVNSTDLRLFKSQLAANSP